MLNYCLLYTIDAVSTNKKFKKWADDDGKPVLWKNSPSNTVLEELVWAPFKNFNGVHFPARLIQNAIYTSDYRNGGEKITEFECAVRIIVAPEQFAKQTNCFVVAKLTLVPFYGRNKKNADAAMWCPVMMSTLETVSRNYNKVYSCTYRFLHKAVTIVQALGTRYKNKDDRDHVYNAIVDGSDADLR